MEYKYVADMVPGDEIEGFYLLSSALVKSTAAGKPYLSGTLADRSGHIELKMWDFNTRLRPEDQGRAVKVRGSVSEFKGALQFMAQRLRFAGEEDSYAVEDLLPTAPIDTEKCFSYVRQLIAGLEDSDYRRAAEAMLERHGEEFRRIPAAKSVHHGFLSGLLMHTANMLQMADFLSGLYGEALDRSLLLAGTLIHDFAKAREFRFSELGMVTGYSVPGDLLGHPVMGAMETAELCRELGLPEEKSVLLQHMVLSHHGEPEFGAAVRPQIAEAELLHYLDLIDSRMEIYAETLPAVPVGEFSGQIYALEKRIYHHG